MYQKWKESPLLERKEMPSNRKDRFTGIVSVFLFAFEFPSHRWYFLSSDGLPRRSLKSFAPGHFFCIKTNFMLNKVLKRNLSCVGVKHNYLLLPHLVSSLKVDWFITLSPLSLFSMTLTIGTVQWVSLLKPVSLMSTSALKWRGWLISTIKLKIMNQGSLLHIKY